MMACVLLRIRKNKPTHLATYDSIAFSDYHVCSHRKKQLWHIWSYLTCRHFKTKKKIKSLYPRCPHLSLSYLPGKMTAGARHSVLSCGLCLKVPYSYIKVSKSRFYGCFETRYQLVRNIKHFLTVVCWIATYQPHLATVQASKPHFKLHSPTATNFLYIADTYSPYQQEMTRSSSVTRKHGLIHFFFFFASRWCKDL